MAKEKNYRHDLFQWRKKQTGDSYEKIAKRSRLSKNGAAIVVKGQTDPNASTLKKICKGMDLDPKYAMDFSLEPSDFHLAVL